jgi:hypothetical protein
MIDDRKPTGLPDDWRTPAYARFEKAWADMTSTTVLWSSAASATRAVGRPGIPCATFKTTGGSTTGFSRWIRPTPVRRFAFAAGLSRSRSTKRRTLAPSSTSIPPTEFAGSDGGPRQERSRSGDQDVVAAARRPAARAARTYRCRPSGCYTPGITPARRRTSVRVSRAYAGPCGRRSGPRSSRRRRRTESARAPAGRGRTRICRTHAAGEFRDAAVSPARTPSRSRGSVAAGRRGCGPPGSRCRPSRALPRLSATPGRRWRTLTST